MLQNVVVDDRNPQAREMADESMVRNLAAQIEAIWPQEQPLVQRYRATSVLDVGCGTGEFTRRVAEMFPQARVVGVDLIDDHLRLARMHSTSRVTYQQADAFELPFAAGEFDLVVCRHMLQAIPHAERVLAEMVRVCRPGGVLHLIPEDYHMIFAAPTRIDVRRFWFEAPAAYAAASGTDLFIGRNVYHHLRALPVDDIDIQYVHVDTQRVARETFARIITAWRDGYSETLAEHVKWPVEQVRDCFDATIETIRDPDGYALWVVPVVSARVR